MAQIKSEAAYRAALKRIDELLPLTGDNVPEDDPNMLELDMLSDMVEEYEDVHYPIGKPELPDIIKLRMYERNLTQNSVAQLLGISATAKWSLPTACPVNYASNLTFLHPLCWGYKTERTTKQAIAD